MKTEETNQVVRKNWILNHWYEKMFYVVGIICSFFFFLGMFIGIIESVVEEL